MLKMICSPNTRSSYFSPKLISHLYMLLFNCALSNRNDITVRFVDENSKELGRDYFVAPQGQCTVSGYGNIKTITPRVSTSRLIRLSKLILSVSC